jgi:plastocyanin
MTGKTLLAGLATLATLACGSSSTGNNPVGDITVQNNSFNPSTFSVSVNTKVTWAWNSGGVSHNVTFDDGEHSVTQGSGEYDRTFTTAGSYPYHCTIHGATMSGTITVT